MCVILWREKEQQKKKNKVDGEGGRGVYPNIQTSMHINFPAIV